MSRLIRIMLASVTGFIMLFGSMTTSAATCPYNGQSFNIPAGVLAISTTKSFPAGATFTVDLGAPTFISFQMPAGTPVFSGGIGGTYSFTIPANTTITSFVLVGGGPISGTVTCSYPDGATTPPPAPPSVPPVLALDPPSPDIVELVRVDANNFAALVGIFVEKRADGTIVVNLYGINPDTGDGVFASSFEISDLPDTPPPANLLLASGTNPFTGQPVQLWWLTTGELQVNSFYADGTPYAYIIPV